MEKKVIVKKSRMAEAVKNRVYQPRSRATSLMNSKSQTVFLKAEDIDGLIINKSRKDADKYFLCKSQNYQNEMHMELQLT